MIYLRLLVLLDGLTVLHCKIPDLIVSENI